MDQMIQSSAAMTETMLGDAEVMPGLGPVPLLQRQSASESRWTRPVPTSRESASKSFGNGCQMQLPELEGAKMERAQEILACIYPKCKWKLEVAGWRLAGGPLSCTV